MEVARGRPAGPGGVAAAPPPGRRHHVVHRHDVDAGVGGGGHLGQLAAAQGEQQRLGHLEALDPPRVGREEGRLHDGGPQHRHRQPDVGGELLDHALAHGLGEGVDVRPAQGVPALAPGVLAGLLHPLAPAALGVGGRGQRPGRAVLGVGLRVEDRQSVGGARGLLQAGRERGGRGQLGAPVHGVVQGGLGHRAATAPGDVGGGDVHVVHPPPALALGVRRPRAPAPAGPGCPPRWRRRPRRSAVEGDLPGAVQHHVQVVGQLRHLARSPSTTSTRAARASGPPAAATAGAKVGLRSTRARRFAPSWPARGRTSTTGRVSGRSTSRVRSSASR